MVFPIVVTAFETLTSSGATLRAVEKQYVEQYLSGSDAARDVVIGMAERQ